MNKKILKTVIIIFLLIIGLNVNAEDNLSGTYNIVSKLDNNKVVDLFQGAIKDCTNIQLYENNGTSAQKGKLT